MTEPATKFAQSMRRDWDDRARKDAFFYIASWKERWDLDSFLRSGEDDYFRFVEPVLERLHFATSGKSMLELGCGAGRMTRSFALRFERVIAYDVSPEMIERARQIHPDLSGVAWRLGDGTNLGNVLPGSLDFVFSYLVLQHLPSEHLVEAYLAEMFRVLAEDGICLFQFNGSNQHNMNWKGRLAWGFADLLWTLRLHKVSRRAAKFLGLDPQMVGKNWHGVAVSADRIRTVICDIGGSILEFSSENTPMAWCCARKGGSAREQLLP